MNEYYIEPERVSDTDTGVHFFYNDFLNNAALAVKPHIHSALEILFICKGSFRIFADDKEFLLSPGDCILFRSHTIHKVYALDGKDSGYYVLKIKPKNLLDSSSYKCGASYLLRLSLSSRNEKAMWTREECENSGISELLSNIVSETENESYGSDIAIKLYSTKILLIMLRDIENCGTFDFNSKDSDESLIRRIYNSIVYINGNYASDITAEQCGKLQYMSYSYFSRSFKRIIGMSFKDYLNMTRINHAEKALMSGDSTITEVAAKCGFNNVSYFISIYKKLKGITPAAFRASLKQ